MLTFRFPSLLQFCHMDNTPLRLFRGRNVRHKTIRSEVDRVCLRATLSELEEIDVDYMGTTEAEKPDGQVFEEDCPPTLLRPDAFG